MGAVAAAPGERNSDAPPLPSHAPPPPPSLSLFSALITKCNYQDTYTTCQQLANMGYLPKGVSSFEAKALTGERVRGTGEDARAGRQ